MAGKPDSKSTKRMTQAQRTALSDERMFEAAMTLILERGTHRTTLKEVGELAGYSRGMANYRFGSKEALFRELIHRCNVSWVRELEQFVGDKKGLAAFEASVDAVEDFLVAAPSNMKVMYILWYESIGHHSELTRKLSEYHERYRRDTSTWLAEAIADGEIAADVDVDNFTAQHLSFVFGSIYQWLVNPESVDVKALFAYHRKTTGLLLRPTAVVTAHLKRV